MERKELERIVSILRKGGVIIFPTETVYGIGASPFNKRAIERIYDIKKRDRKKPLTFHISHPNYIYKFAYVDNRAKRLIENFLPGPLTLILPKKRNVPRSTVGGKTKIAFRVPECSVAREIIEYFGAPIAATSVNISGEPPINDIDSIIKRFGHLVDFIVKEKCVLSKQASTIIDLTKKPFRILRIGEITPDEIEKILKGGKNK